MCYLSTSSKSSVDELVLLMKAVSMRRPLLRLRFMLAFVSRTTSIHLDEVEGLSPSVATAIIEKGFFCFIFFILSPQLPRTGSPSIVVSYFFPPDFFRDILCTPHISNAIVIITQLVDESSLPESPV